MKLLVSAPNGRSLEMELSPDMSVEVLLLLLSEDLAIPQEHLSVLQSGTQLDPAKTLESYSLTDGDSLTVRDNRQTASLQMPSLADLMQGAQAQRVSEGPSLTEVS